MRYEHDAYAAGFNLIAGIDEAGRGPLAGPVVAAAVIWPPDLEGSKDYKKFSGINDSKQLTPQKREHYYHLIREHALSIGIGMIPENIIDEINILQATYCAMQQAVADLSVCPNFLLVDALTIPKLSIPQKGIKKGDTLSLSIAAASIIAKVARDHWMEQMHNLYPRYNFASHKGYGTSEHLAALEKHGPCPIHRRSFRGVVMESSQISLRDN